MRRLLFLLDHIALCALVAIVFHQGARDVVAPWAFLAFLALAELFFLFQYRKEQNRTAASWIILLIWLLMLVWECCATQWDVAHPVLIPSPENVFNVFFTEWKQLLRGLYSSTQLLVIGFALALSLGVGLGLLTGWVDGLRRVAYPIAYVISPIPPVVYAPYLIALMPTFRSASALVITLGIFFPTYLNMIVRVQSVDRRIIDSARMLGVTTPQMVGKILLPYVLPGLVSSLKVSLSMSVMMLTFAEMMGATSGVGYFIINYTHYGNYTNVVAGIILVAVWVTVLNKLVNLLERKVVKGGEGLG
ncbi:MAG: ABC transporter permease subunit [Firmicutes bacterium]|nr:ABC transporter permease subunit [Bacillota bacterium]